MNEAIAHIFGISKRVMRRSGLRGVVRRVGVLGLGRRMHQRAVLRSGVHRTSLIGHPVAFAVDTPLDITLIDAPDLDDEKLFIEQLLDALHPGDVMMDIGAHLGMVAVLVGVVGRDRDVRVLAFEPDQVIADRARRSVELNGLENVEVVPVALGDADGTIRLALRRSSGGNTSSVVIDDRPSDAVEVPVCRGDDFLNKRDLRPNILKIDIEGAEHLALRGLESSLRAGSVREIFVEVHPRLLEMTGSSAEALRDWLSVCGYELVWERPRRAELHWRLTQRELLENVRS